MSAATPAGTIFGFLSGLAAFGTMLSIISNDAVRSAALSVIAVLWFGIGVFLEYQIE